MAHITELQVTAACEMGRRVFAGEIKAKEAVEELRVRHGLNLASANDFINDYKHLMLGNVFHRAMSADAMHHFLSSIFQTYGTSALVNSVKALNAHIAYWERHYKTNAIKMRKVAVEFQAQCEKAVTESEYRRKLEGAVEASLKDSRSQRLRRLSSASAKPTKVLAKTIVYIRNPDVIAEVLLRAKGKCEKCGANAPFLRARDQTPYLEVHHKIQLAHDGDDSVLNAMALCPNCHREFHYGA
jgi:5-methylcytosine-specific restriction enzyme A